MNMKRVAGFHMGVVIFVHQNDALDFVEYGNKHGISFDGQPAKVILYRTATYPLSSDLSRKIFEGGHTRCVSIKGAPDRGRYSAVATYIQLHLPMYFALGDRMIENAEATELVIRFNSIQAAGAALETLRVFPRLAECEFGFAPDPCADPLPGSEDQ